MSLKGDSLIGSELAGYRVVGLLGSGGMSTVYLAEDERLGRKVALKLLATELAEDERFRTRFLRESKLAASIDHSNIVPVYEAGEADGVLYIAMRRVEGTDLRELLRREGPLEPRRAFALLAQVADALDAAHERGLVHRDVKPSNVLVARESGREHCYLSDFGLTKSAASLGDLTEAGHLLGTIDYVAPEQIEGAPVDGRADVYSLACVLFECLTGEVPFLRESDLAVLWAHVQDPPPSLHERQPTLPTALNAVIAKGMAKDRDQRYPTCGELIAAARAALAGELPVEMHTAKRKPTRRRATFIAAAVILAATALGLIAALANHFAGKEVAPTFEPGIAIIDVQTGEMLAAIPTTVVREPQRIEYADGHFWVQDLDPLSFVEIDPKTGRALRQIGSPAEEGVGFAVSGDTLWVTGPKVFKIDIDLGRVVDRFSYSDWHSGVIVAEGSLWVAIDEATLRVDPATGKVEHRFDDLSGPVDLAYEDGALWTTGPAGVSRIDLETNAVTKTELQLPEDVVRVAAGGGFGWTADPTKGFAYKIDRGGRIAATYKTGQGAKDVSYSEGTLWVANSDLGTVVGIDPVTGGLRTLRFEHPVQGAAAGSGVLLVSLVPGRTYEDRIDALEGKVAKLFVPLYGLEVPDAAIDDTNYWLEYATCAKLLNYPDAPAPEGWELRPEVAASMPTVSPDGRTYTFRIRPGYRFSPPSNEEVTAETFRYSIERALSPRLEGPAPYFVSDIEGERAFRAGKADQISGLRARDDLLTIRLTRPSPNLLQRLALSYFCPVPTNSPFVPGGAGAYVQYAGREPQAVPAAGPYYVADHLNAEYAILRRNPNYPGPRPQRLDAIAFREGIDPGQAVSRVQEGSWDGIVGIDDPLLEVGGPLDQQWGAGSEAAARGDQRYIATPTPQSGYILFNAGGLFADRAVRRAAAFALDRQALAEVWKQVPSDQLLPPVMPGFEERDFYRLDGPELAKARALMDGRRGSAVMGISPDCDQCLREAQLVKADLAAIDIDVRIRTFENLWEAAKQPDAKIDLLDAGWTLDYADPAEFLRGMLVRGVPTPDWLPAGVAADVRAVARLEGAERETAAAELADRLAVREVPLAAVGNRAATGFFSPRLGCRVFPPFGYGIDLAALCIEEET